MCLFCSVQLKSWYGKKMEPRMSRGISTNLVAGIWSGKSGGGCWVSCHVNPEADEAEEVMPISAPPTPSPTLTINQKYKFDKI